MSCTGSYFEVPDMLPKPAFTDHQLYEFTSVREAVKLDDFALFVSERIQAGSWDIVPDSLSRELRGWREDFEQAVQYETTLLFKLRLMCSDRDDDIKIRWIDIYKAPRLKVRYKRTTSALHTFDISVVNGRVMDLVVKAEESKTYDYEWTDRMRRHAADVANAFQDGDISTPYHDCFGLWREFKASTTLTEK